MAAAVRAKLRFRLLHGERERAVIETPIRKYKCIWDRSLALDGLHRCGQHYNVSDITPGAGSHDGRHWAGGEPLALFATG